MPDTKDNEGGSIAFPDPLSEFQFQVVPEIWTNAVAVRIAVTVRAVASGSHCCASEMLARNA
jgi:hypothetical protein